MKIVDVFKLGFKNFIRNKKNIIIIFLIALTSSAVIFAISFNQNLNRYWKDSIKKMMDYRMFFTYYDYNMYKEEEAIEKLKTYNHIETVAPFSSYLITMIANDYKQEKKTNGFFLIGAPSNPVNTYIGKNLNSYTNKEKVMICADKFYPFQNDSIYNRSKKDLIDLTSRVGDTIPLSFINSDKIEKFKLIGLYNAELNNTDGNVCYTSSENVSLLNLYYQKEVYEEEGTILPIIMIIDNVENISQTLEQIKEDSFFTNGAVLRTDTEFGDKIINIILLITIIMFVLSFTLSSLISFKNYEIRKKDFGILKATGYKNSDIAKIQYGESILIFLSSFILSIILSSLLMYVFKILYIAKSLNFNGMNITISLSAIIISFIFTLLILLSITFITNKKIKKTTTINIIKG